MSIAFNSTQGVGVTLDVARFLAGPGRLRAAIENPDSGSENSFAEFSRAPGGVKVTLDMSMMGATATLVRCLDDAGNILFESVEPSGQLEYRDLETYVPDEVAAKHVSAGKVSMQDFHFAYSVKGKPSAKVLRLVGGNVTVHNVATVVVVGNQDFTYPIISPVKCTMTEMPVDDDIELCVRKANLDYSGGVKQPSASSAGLLGIIQVHAEGLAHLGVESNDLDGDGIEETYVRCSNLDPTGLEGITVTTKKPPANTQPRKEYVGHVTLIRREIAPGVSGTLNVAHSPGRVDLLCDNTQLGALQTLVTAYDQWDNPMAEYVLPPNVPVSGIAFACGPLEYPKYVLVGSKWYFVGCVLADPNGYRLVIPGQPELEGVHSISFEPLNPTVPESDTIVVTAYGDGTSDILLTEATLIPAGRTCDSIDFNNDGSFFDPTDIDAFLSVFSEGPCLPELATCNDIDFNNDGGLFDPCDINSFLTVYAEGPCSACGE
jgi:hypothetical protein